MKILVVLLLVANIVAAAWISQRPPNDILREPGRINAQIAGDQFRLLSDAELADLQKKAKRESKSQDAAASAEPAVQPDVQPDVQPAATPAADPATSPAAPAAGERP